ncbi:MFS multidrug transporter [Ramaria rubella]|nr:MFS multidrug transporter [Ramaria rubella]
MESEYTDAPNDPHNWPSRRKNTLLWVASLHSMQGPFSAAITIPAFMDLSKEFRVDLNTAAYLTSVPIIFLGVFPIIWSPFSDRFGRRPIYLVSAIVSAACSLGGIFCHSYGSLMTTRIIQAIFLAPPLSIGACTIREMFFAQERSQKIGFWALMVTVGPSLGPVVVGFLVQEKGWRAAFILTSALQLALFVAHIFLGPETLFLSHDEADEKEVEKETENGVLPGSKFEWRRYVHFVIYDHSPIRMMEFLNPCLMAGRAVILLPAAAYGFVYAYTSVLLNQFCLQIFGMKFGLGPGQIGLQMLAPMIGAMLGELFAGRGSDAFVNWRTKRTGIRIPEYRLSCVYPGFVLSIVGVVVWGIQLQNATPGVWNITPDVGSAVALFGQQIVATVCTTYAIESHLSETASVTAFVACFRQLFAFLAPFYLGNTVTNLGTAKAVGVLSSIMGIGLLMMVACHIWGSTWRNNHER